MSKPIVQLCEKKVVLSNHLGYEVVFPIDENGYGEGLLYLDGVLLGRTECLKQDRVARTMLTPPYHRTERLCHRLTQVEILENSMEKGVVRFSGMSLFFTMQVDVTLRVDGKGISFCYQVRSSNAFEEITHQPYVQAEFCPEKAVPEFTQYPFQEPLLAEENSRWGFVPQKYFVPFMFGKQRSERENFYMGIGYHLEQEYWTGRIEYEPADDNGIFKVFPCCRLPMKRSEQASSFCVVVSYGRTQSDCVEGYRTLCGYDMSLPDCRRVEESERLFMSVYKNSSTYRDGLGYHQQVLFSTGQPGLNGYGRYIALCANLGLAYNLYNWWLRNPKEQWAKKRAFEMVEFFRKSQHKHGGVPNLYDPDCKRFLTYAQLVKKTRTNTGMETWFMPKAETVYTTHMMAMGAYYMLRLCETRRRLGEDCDEWVKSAERAMEYLMDRVQPDGLISRNFSTDGEPDDICANAWFLISLDYFHHVTRKKRYAEVRDKVEKWVQSTFADTNFWCNWSADAGWWRGQGYPVTNHDAFEVPTYATYCFYRHIRTKDGTYLQRMKDAISYLWLCMIPIQFENFTNLTKGLIKEQDTYATFDVPMNTTRIFDGLPWLSAVTGERFYADFYRFMLQVQMHYQATDTDFPAFRIGLEWSRDGVLDEIGEADRAYISEFAGVILLDSINSEYAFRYVGGEDWCVGLDDEPTLISEGEKYMPYVAYSTLSLREVSFSTENQTLKITLSETALCLCKIAVRAGELTFARAIFTKGDKSGTTVEVEAQYDENTRLLEFEFEASGDVEFTVYFD